VLAAYAQLRLARQVAADQRLPWERPRPPLRLSPYRVRRGFPRRLCALGSPAATPKPAGRSPGRPRAAAQDLPGATRRSTSPPPSPPSRRPRPPTPPDRPAPALRPPILSAHSPARARVKSQAKWSQGLERRRAMHRQVREAHRPCLRPPLWSQLLRIPRRRAATKRLSLSDSHQRTLPKSPRSNSHSESKPTRLRSESVAIVRITTAKRLVSACVTASPTAGESLIARRTPTV
jgi:hypothetical protein